MGDINLLYRINRLAKKVSGAVFPSDKASKTKFGIVKIGTNINVSSGTISVPDATNDTKGVIALGDIVAGCVVEKIFDGSVVQGSETIYDLLKPYTDFKIMVFCISSATSSSFGSPCIVSEFATGANNNNVAGLTGLTSSFRLNSEDATKISFPQGTGSVAIKIYGIK